jgi:hypothetical protein
MIASIMTNIANPIQPMVMMIQVDQHQLVAADLAVAGKKNKQLKSGSTDIQ